MHLQVRRRLDERHVCRVEPAAVLLPAGQNSRFLKHEAEREANVKGHGGLDLVNVGVRERQLERGDIALEMLDLAAADDGEDVRCLVADVC